MLVIGDVVKYVMATLIKDHIIMWIIKPLIIAGDAFSTPRDRYKWFL